MLEEAEVNDPFPPLGFEAQEGYEIVEGPEEIIQDQIIILPEIMSKILEQLDLRSLKNSRLVCKSWLKEAQTHLEQRGTVRLSSSAGSTRIEDFIHITNEKLPGIPQPFKSVKVNLLRNLNPDEFLSTQLSSLRPPLGITRLSPSKLPLRLILPLILQHSSTLESLHLYREASEAEDLPLPGLDSEETLPKLRQLLATIVTDSEETVESRFSSVIAWVVKASPNLESFQHLVFGDGGLGLGRELVLQRNIRNIKTLLLRFIVWDESYVRRVLLEEFASIPFRQLQNLTLFVHAPPSSLPWGTQAALKIIERSRDTLRTLNLSDISTGAHNPVEVNFPVCPNILELTVSSLALFSKHIVPNHFPALRILNVCRVNRNDHVYLSTLPRFPGVKTLRLGRTYVNLDENLNALNETCFEFQFFDKFPALERLNTPVSFLMRCCRIKAATGLANLSSLLAGVKHLELHEIGQVTHHSRGSRPGSELSSLFVLKEIETIAMLSFNEEVLATIPVRYLPNLRVVEFPWGNCSSLDDILEMIARGVGLKVIITNCCSARRVIADPASLELLETFFQSVPNAECGCENRRIKWYSFFLRDDDE